MSFGTPYFTSFRFCLHSVHPCILSFVQRIKDTMYIHPRRPFVLSFFFFSSLFACLRVCLLDWLNIDSNLTSSHLSTYIAVLAHWA